MFLIGFGSVVFPETWNDYTQFAFAAKGTLKESQAPP